MQRKHLKVLATVLSCAMVLGGVNLPSIKASAASTLEWREEGAGKFWYEDGVKQGTTGRGKEIYDPKSDAWYWLDSVDGGKMATGKDVYQDSYAAEYADELEAKNMGKWCRYDAEGRMIKGWAKGECNEKEGKSSVSITSPDEAGADEPVYYFDPLSGSMAKGVVLINEKLYTFDTVFGTLVKDKTQDKPEGFKETGWNTIDGVEYFFQNGVKQGVFGNGKEIQDPETGNWYWLDSVNGGQKAVAKEVLITSGGENKWVRYDDQGQMIKGWFETDGKKYYYDLVTGEMVHGYREIDGKTYKFNFDTGICEGEKTEKLVTHTYDYYRAVKQVTKDADGKEIEWAEYEYDTDRENGYPNYKSEKRWRLMDDGEKKLSSYYLYDENGNTKESMWLNWDYEYDEETGRYDYDKKVYYESITTYEYEKYEYEENGNKYIGYYQKSSTSKQGDKLISKGTYEYDTEKHRLTKGTTYRYDEEKKDWVENGRIEYHYDENGNRDLATRYQKNAEGKEYKYEDTKYEYEFVKNENYTNGGWYTQKLYEYIYYNEDGEISSKNKTEYVHDDKGNTKEYKSFYWDSQKKEYVQSYHRIYNREEREVGTGDNKYKENVLLEQDTYYYSHNYDKDQVMVREYDGYVYTYSDVNIQTGEKRYNVYAEYDSETYQYKYFDSEKDAKEARKLMKTVTYEYSDKYLETGAHDGDYTQTTKTFNKDDKLTMTTTTDYKKYTVTYTYVTYE